MYNDNDHCQPMYTLYSMEVDLDTPYIILILYSAKDSKNKILAVFVVVLKPQMFFYKVF